MSNLTGFREFLEKNNLEEDIIEQAILIVRDLLKFLNIESKNSPTVDDISNFSKYLIENDRNRYDNYIHLYRYGLFSKNDNLVIGILELIDGREMLPNFSKRLIEEYSQEFRDTIFGDYQLPPSGTNLKEHNKCAIQLFERYLKAVSKAEADKFFVKGLRDKYTQSYVNPKEMFNKSSNLDEFLDWYRDNFVNNIKKHRDDSTLFYIQEVDDKFVEYASTVTETGRRDGNVINITKIPYLTKEYLEADTQNMKNYYCCHNPLFREALIDGEHGLDPVLCNISAGYYKNFWEAIFECSVKVCVKESVIMGHENCKFVVHIPDVIKLD